MVCCCLCAAAVLVVPIVIYFIIRHVLGQMCVQDLKKKAVFITGCDSGFGRLLALKCASNGITVFAGCFTKEIEHLFAGEKLIHPLHVDVTQQRTINDAVRYVEDHLRHQLELWAVVNNAGIFATYGPEEWTKVEDYQRALDVNTIGVIRVVHAFRALIKKSKGRFITTASMAGRVVLPLAGSYSMSKFATEAYMDSLRRDMKPFGIKCSIIEPGSFRTTFVDPKAVQERLQASWERLTDEEKSEYGEEYRQRCVDEGPKLIEKAASTHFNYVTDSQFHAITARYPRARYPCGCDVPFYILVTLLPTALGDALTNFWLGMPVAPALAGKQKND